MKRPGMMVLVFGLTFFTQMAQAQWTSARRLTATSGHSYGPVVAFNSAGDLHLVWEDDTPGNSEIYYKKSTDGGATWTTSKRLTSTSGDSYNPAIAIYSFDNLHLVWEDDTPGKWEIYYKNSADGGATWTMGKTLTASMYSSGHPVIAVDSVGNLHVVWTNYTPWENEIYYKKSTDGGGTWTTSKSLPSTSGDSYNPTIAVDFSDKLHVVWSDDTPGQTEIYYTRSTDAGATWTASKRLTSTPGYSESPDIAVDSSNNLHVVWCEGTSENDEIYYKKSTDGGATWTMGKRLTATPGDSKEPAIAVDSSGNPHVVWEEEASGGDEIYYKKSADGGVTWTTSNRFAMTSDDCEAPSIAADLSGDLHILWPNNAPGNYEIYYKKGK